MKPSPADRGEAHVSAQVAASWTALDAAHRAGELAAALRGQDRAFLGAMRELRVVWDFVGSPGNILGSTDTKHGEIAEQVHVGVSRARDVLYGRAPAATFDGVRRTGPVDYRVDGVDIQSKYYNGLRNTLGGVALHGEKYREFAGEHGRHHIPSDQHQQLNELRQNGRIEGLSDRSAATIKGRVDDLERKTGRSVNDLIEPGDATYREVQRGRVHETLHDREDALARENEDLREAARAKHGASLEGLGTAAALGAAAGGGVSLAQAIWVKCREGQNPFRGEFSSQDWQDVGLVAAHGLGGGAVAGSAVYVLTNSTALAAPFAGSLVSALMGVGALLRDHHAGTIDGDQFVELSQIVAFDAAVAGLAVAAGQTLVPLPMLGALVGSLAGRIVASALKDGLGDSASDLAARLAGYERDALEQLDEEYRVLVQRLDAWFGNLEHLAATAFDLERNTTLRLDASVQVAETVGVPAPGILRTIPRSRRVHAGLNMDPLRDPLDGLSPSLYVATLSEIAHVDGLHPAERELLDQHAAHFGVDLNSLPTVPRNLSTLPWATRVLVYRDAVTLALADGMSVEEEQHLRDLAHRMELPAETVAAVSKWVGDYEALLARLDALINT